MPTTIQTTDVAPEPTIADLDGVIADLKRSWTARISIRRPAVEDVAYKDIFVSLDGESLGLLPPGQEFSREVRPGPHRLRVHNTLFWRTSDVIVQVSEHASFVAVNRPGFGTFSILAYFLGTNLVYLTLERDELLGPA